MTREDFSSASTTRRSLSRLVGTAELLNGTFDTNTGHPLGTRQLLGQLYSSSHVLFRNQDFLGGFVVSLGGALVIP